MDGVDETARARERVWNFSMVNGKKNNTGIHCFLFGLRFSLHMQINLSVPSVSAATVYVLFRHAHTQRRAARSTTLQQRIYFSMCGALRPRTVDFIGRLSVPKLSRNKKKIWMAGVCIPWNKYKSIFMSAFLKLCPFHAIYAIHSLWML